MATFLQFFSGGQLSLEEFTKLVVDRIAEKDYRQDILLAFRLFDDDETGKISLRNLKRIAKGLGEKMTDDELQVITLCHRHRSWRKLNLSEKNFILTHNWNLLQKTFSNYFPFVLFEDQIYRMGRDIFINNFLS